MRDEPKDIRFQLLLSQAEAEAIDQWRTSNRVPSRNEAIRRLAARGLYRDIYSDLMSDVFELLDLARMRGALTKQEQDVFHNILMKYTSVLQAEQKGAEPSATPKG